MSARRMKRFDRILDPRATIEALGACRNEMIRVSTGLRPGCETYKEATGLIDAIDRLAGVITGDPTYFHAGGSAPVTGVLNGIPVGREG